MGKTYLIALEASIRTNITSIVQNAVTKHLIILPVTTVTSTWTPHFARGVGRRWKMADKESNSYKRKYKHG